jgi:hypothetical protein
MEENKQNETPVLDEVIREIFRIIDTYYDEYAVRDIKKLLGRNIERGILEEIEHLPRDGA